MKDDKLRPTYLMIPRKLVIAWIVSFLCLLIGVIASFQYANYVDRRSNMRLCGVVTMYTKENIENPPASALGRNLGVEFLKLKAVFSCK